MFTVKNYKKLLFKNQKAQAISRLGFSAINQLN